MDITTLAQTAASQAEHVVRRMIAVGWSVCHFHHLPDWLQVSSVYSVYPQTKTLQCFKDNDFLERGHRPPLPSFRACFKSIFRIHTETGNIWTHMLGCVAFIGKLLEDFDWLSIISV